MVVSKRGHLKVGAAHGANLPTGSETESGSLIQSFSTLAAGCGQPQESLADVQPPGWASLPPATGWNMEVGARKHLGSRVGNALGHRSPASQRGEKSAIQLGPLGFWSSVPAAQPTD